MTYNQNQIQWKYDSSNPSNFYNFSNRSTFGSNLGTSTPSTFGSNLGTSTPSTFVSVETQTDYSNLHLVNIDLPKNKIEGMLNIMINLLKYKEIDIENMVSDIFESNKINKEDLWFMSLIKYSDKNFILNKVQKEHILFESLFSGLLQALMFEKIKNPSDLYEWLINFAKVNKNKKMLWLFTILQHAKEQLEIILDKSDILEMFVLALYIFIKYDNMPHEAIKTVLSFNNILYKMCLSAMIGASYGMLPEYLDNNIAYLVNLFEVKK